MSKLDDEFNLSELPEHTEEKEVFEDAVVQIKETKAKISEFKNQKYDINDKEYIREQLVNLIDLNRSVLENVALQCKIGAPPGTFMSFTQISNAITANIQELLSLNKMLTDYQIKDDLVNKKKGTGVQNAQNIQNNTFVMNHEDLVKHLTEAGLTKKTYELPKFIMDQAK